MKDVDEPEDGPIQGLLGGFPCQVGPSIKYNISNLLHPSPAALQGASKAGRMEGMGDKRTCLLAEFFRLWDTSPWPLILGPISNSGYIFGPLSFIFIICCFQNQKWQSGNLSSLRMWLIFLECGFVTSCFIFVRPVFFNTYIQQNCHLKMLWQEVSKRGLLMKWVSVKGEEVGAPAWVQVATISTYGKIKITKYVTVSYIFLSYPWQGLSWTCLHPDHSPWFQLLVSPTGKII